MRRVGREACKRGINQKMERGQTRTREWNVPIAEERWAGLGSGVEICRQSAGQ